MSTAPSTRAYIGIPSKFCPTTIDRIEVISGPAGTLWGANAMNGVINIITRKSSDTQGGVVNAGGGNLRAAAVCSTEAKLAATQPIGSMAMVFMSVMTNWTPEHASGLPAAHIKVAFVSTGGPPGNLATLQGDDYSGTEEQAGGIQFLSGHNLTARLNRQLENGSALQVQAYYDNVRRFGENGGGGFGVDTYDLDIQHSFALGDWNNVVWGAGDRVNQFNIVGIPGAIEFTPANQTLNLGNIFVEDTMSLSNSFKLIIGTKLEDDPYVGISPLPSVRASWKVTDTDFLWSAVSRAIRAPTPFDRDLNLGGGFLVGGPDFQSENSPLTSSAIAVRSRRGRRFRYPAIITSTTICGAWN